MTTQDKLDLVNKQYEDLFEKDILFIAFPLPPYHSQYDKITYPVALYASKMQDICFRPDMLDSKYQVLSYRLDPVLGPSFLIQTKVNQIINAGALARDSFCVSVSYYSKEDGNHEDRFAKDTVIDRINTANSSNPNSHIWFPYSTVLSRMVLSERVDRWERNHDIYRENYANGILLNGVTFKAFESQLLVNSVVSTELEKYLAEIARVNGE